MNTPREPDVGETTATLPEPQMTAQVGFYARVGVLLLSALLLYVVARVVAPLWQPLVWAVMIGALLAPLNARLAARLGGRPQLASGITTLGVLLLLLLPLLGVVAAVATQAGQLVSRINASSLRVSSSLDLSTYPLLARPLQWLEVTAGVKLEQIEAWVVTAARRLLEIVASSGGSVVLGAVGTLVSVVLTLFVLFFVLRDGPRFASLLVRMLPIEPQLRGKLWRHLIDVTRAVFMGIGLTAVAQGVLLGVGFALAGLPSPLVFGVLAVLFALVPFVGPAILWIPAALWLLSQGQPYWAIFLTVWGVVLVGSVDNFLRPMLISGRAEVPTLAVFIGVMGGLSAFGFVGLFLGPIVLGLLVALFRFAAETLAPESGEA
jgi:predicted PurR-regulated permease PerM